MDEKLAGTIGAAVRRARERTGRTQHEAAEAAGISFEFYARIERGKTLPSVPTLKALAVALETSADVVLGIRADDAAEPVMQCLPKRLVENFTPKLTLEQRRLQRRVEAASPKTVLLLSLLATALER